jgi:hypothetical protein
MLRYGLAHLRLGSTLRLFLMVVICLKGLAAQAQPKEFQVKAVFLYNFSQFVEWPAAAFSSPSAPFVIGIIGHDPFGDYLDATVQGEQISGHPIIVKRFADVKDVHNCHILYIGDRNISQVLQSLRGQSILTVGDTTDFNHYGGIIQFFTEQSKIRLQISPAAARAAKLSISSKLLRLAKIVE